MTKNIFKAQMDRIIAVFGEENYHEERIKLIFKEVHDLDGYQWQSVVDHLIATKPVRYAPLMQDFRDACNQERKKQFNREVIGAARVMRDNKGLQEYLDSMGAESLIDAVKKSKP